MPIFYREEALEYRLPYRLHLEPVSQNYRTQFAETMALTARLPALGIDAISVVNKHS